jgi:hypothetical protein
MDKKEFIKIVREVQKLQIKLLKTSNMSINTGLNNNSVNSSDYTFSLFLFTYGEDKMVKDVKGYIIYSFDTITKANGILRDIMQRVETNTIPLRGNKAKRSGASDTPIK